MPPLQKQVNDKDATLLDYNDTVNQLISYAKRDLDNINHEIVLANANLSRLKEKIIKDTNELERWKSQEKLKFNNDINQIKNDIIVKQNTVNLHVQQQERMTQDLQIQQQRFENMNSDRIKLKEEMVKLEGRKIEIEDMLKQAEIVKSESINSRNQITMLHQEALQIQEKNKQENIRLVNLNDSLEQRGKKIEEEYKNLLGLKEFVEPKLRSIKEEQENLDKIKKDNQNKIDELNSKIQEESINFKALLDKKSEIEKMDRDLLSKKEEFQRQQVLSGK